MRCGAGNAGRGERQALGRTVCRAARYPEGGSRICPTRFRVSARAPRLHRGRCGDRAMARWIGDYGVGGVRSRAGGYSRGARRNRCARRGRAASGCDAVRARCPRAAACLPDLHVRFHRRAKGRRGRARPALDALPGDRRAVRCRRSRRGAAFRVGQFRWCARRLARAADRRRGDRRQRRCTVGRRADRGGDPARSDHGGRVSARLLAAGGRMVR